MTRNNPTENTILELGLVRLWRCRRNLMLRGEYSRVSSIVGEQTRNSRDHPERMFSSNGRRLAIGLKRTHADT